MKTCTKSDCAAKGSPQPLSAFHQDRQKRDGLRSWCKSCTNRKVKEYQMGLDPEVFRARRKRTLIKYYYGLSVEEYERLLERSDNHCELCERELGMVKRSGLPISEACVDHCHRTGQIRGILCPTCNTGLGSFHDDPMLLLAAINYLKRPTDA